MKEGKNMRKVFSVIFAAVLVFCMTFTAYAKTSKALRFGTDGKFTILQITDPQDDQHPSGDMLKLISLAIEKADPDLVVFSGDLVEDKRLGDIGTDDEDLREGVCAYDSSGNVDHDKTLANVRTACGYIFNEVESKSIPFAVALGNNDYQTGVTSDEWLDILDDYPMNLTIDESSDSDGRVDYNLDILSSSDENTAFELWMMDTKTTAVTDSQLDWFKDAGAVLKSENGGVPVPSIVFQHIPVDDVGNLFEPCNIWDAGALPSGGSFYRLNKDIANGYNKSVMLPGKTTSEFNAWKDNGGVLAAFFGHLHTEGYSGKWNGIELGLTYGSQFAKSGPYGARVITLHENNPADYGDAQYVYEGSVSGSDAHIVTQIDKPYPVYNGFFESFEGYFINTFTNLWQTIFNTLTLI